MAKYLLAMEKIDPPQRCHKCGKKYWKPNVEPFCWSCLYCGNLIYYTYGIFRQQIDIVLNSNRGWEFVRSTSGKGVIPIKDELHKEVMFKEKIKKKNKKNKNKNKNENSKNSKNIKETDQTGGARAE